jgi:hypothetical protein
MSQSEKTRNSEGDGDKWTVEDKDRPIRVSLDRLSLHFLVAVFAVREAFAGWHSWYLQPHTHT